MLKLQQLPNKINRLQKRIREELRVLNQPMVDLSGIQIPISYQLSREVREGLYRGDYEKPELQMIKVQLRPNDIVMEIGAGIGLISSYCAKMIGSERVFAYEANPIMERHIRKTYKLNGICPNLEICMIGTQTGQQTFYVEENFWSSSGIQRSPKAKAIQVPVKSFNQEVRRINPTFLSIDIEGGEYDLMQHADFYNVQRIVIELHERVIGHDKVEFVKEKLAQAGFQVNEVMSEKEQLFLQRST